MVPQLYKFKLNLKDLGNKIFGLDMWWVSFGKQPNTSPAACSLPLLSRVEGENRLKKLVGRDEDRETGKKLLSWSKQTRYGEN